MYVCVMHACNVMHACICVMYVGDVTYVCMQMWCVYVCHVCCACMSWMDACMHACMRACMHAMRACMGARVGHPRRERGAVCSSSTGKGVLARFAPRRELNSIIAQNFEDLTRARAV